MENIKASAPDSAFANLYKNVMGLTDSFNIQYIDSTGNESQAWVKPYDFKADTMNKRP